MKVLEWSQQISNCKSKQIFYDAQRQLTPQSEVCSASSSNLSSFLWLSLLPATMKALEWSQHYPLLRGALNISEPLPVKQDKFNKFISPDEGLFE